MRCFSDLKGTKAGQACIVLGNGPTLTIDLIEKIKKIGLFSFSANGFCLIFDKTDFRPDAVCMSNLDAVRNYGLSYPDHTLKFFVQGSEDLIGRKLSGMFELPFSCEHDKGIHKDPFIGDKNFSTDPSMINFCGDTVILDFAIPVACFMGFSEIYLCGVDCDYSKGYFCQGYEKRAVGGFRGMIHGDYSIAIPAYKFTKEYLHKNGCRLFRLTPSERLYFIDQVDIDALSRRLACSQP